MSGNNKENTNWNAFLFIAFWVAVLIECVGLFNRNYIVFGFSRIFLAPILLIRVIWSPVARRVSIYVYLFLLFSMVADFMTIFGNQYIGLNLFTIIFLSLGCYFQQIKDNHNNSHLVFILTTVFVAIGCIIWLFAPELQHKVFYAQVTLHVGVILNLAYWLFSVRHKKDLKVFGTFLFAVLVIIVTNSVYALDALYLHWRYSFEESLVGLGNGMYLFLITRAALKYVKRG